ncbi:MAG: N-acetylmuramoyl-L-alanine amidase [Bacteroidota bacterium]|nr:N-acetylmuramoyl-L-alanine amidase [Bacteroidota bacterium]
MYKKIGSALLFLLFTSCTPSRYAAANRSYKKQVRAYARILKKIPPREDSSYSGSWVGTTNFGLRKPDLVIIHHTAEQDCDQTLKTFTNPATQVSAHYVICKNGTIYHMLSDYLRAWQAGVSSWGNERDINSCSIGIELDNNGIDTFPDSQIQSLLGLLARLKEKYHIPTANFIGHEDIAPTRKVDPNVHFPWELLASQGFGYWYGDTSQIMVPADFDDVEALRVIGYAVTDSAAAIEAFKRHFEGQDSSRTFCPRDRKILYSLMRRYESPD